MFLYFVLFILIGLFAISFVHNRHGFSNTLILSGIIVVLVLNAYFNYANTTRLLPLLIIIVLVLLGALFISFMFVAAGITSIKREGMSISHVLSIAFGIFYWGFIAAAWYVFVSDEFTFIIQGLLFFVIIGAYIFYTFTSLYIYSIFYRIVPKNKTCDFIIVHGAGLMNGCKVTPLLAGRLKKAIQIYEASEEKASFVVSGGKGDDEKISEAEAMKNYLLEQGIDDKHIILEDKSTNTLENLSFSKTIMDSLKEEYNCLFVTSDYHVFRTGNYAKKVGLKIDGVGCKTALYYWPNAFIREYIAIMLQHKKSSAVIIGLGAIGILALNSLF